MITLNLLPDIKKEYLKSQRTKHMFVAVSFFVTAGAIGVVVLAAMYVFGVQKLQIYNSQNSIDSSIETINNTPDLAKIITVQNQLNALPDLHDTKTATTRLSGYLKTITPSDIKLSSVAIDFENYSMEITGTGKDFKSVNTFVDTLKNASYVYADKKDATMAFSGVVLESLGKSDDYTGFKVTFAYEPLIFDNSVTGMKLTVPKITSSNSETEKPKSLFDGKAVEEGSD